MNRHTKMAFFVAPFLLIGGYIASDFYMESKAQETRLYQLSPSGSCDVINQECVLTSGEFKINVFDVEGMTQINSTFPLDSATLFLVDDQDQMTPHPLGMSDSPYYWRSSTALRELAGQAGASYKLRLIANIKGGKYLSEFTTTTR